MKKGTVVLTPFPFTDLSGSKRRPAVIVSKKSNGNDVVISYITSQLHRPAETDYVLETTHPHFKETGLKVSSVIKLAKLVTLEKDILIGELGYCSEVIISELDKRLKITFGI